MQTLAEQHQGGFSAAETAIAQKYFPATEKTLPVRSSPPMSTSVSAEVPVL
jgi:hypothetical protein